MGLTRIVGVLLIVAGAVTLATTKFSYTKAEHQAKLGPLELSVKEKETVKIPTWASVAALVAGGGLLLVGSKRR